MVVVEFSTRVAQPVHVRASSAVIRLVLCAAVLVLLAACAAASPIVYSFEGLPGGPLVVLGDGEFAGAVVLTAGVTLNEFDFPPRSGVNVISDDGGPITIAFGSPVAAVGAYVTYAVPMLFHAFDLLGRPVAVASSAYANNLATSGDPGSSPNEFVEVRFSGGISSVVVEGGGGGGTFALDDLTVNPVPEPGSGLLFAAGLLAIGVARILRPRRSRRGIWGCRCAL